MQSFVGIDLGTSACRACAVDARGTQLAFASTPLPQAIAGTGGISQNPSHWWNAVQRVFPDLLQQISPQSIRAICIDGTSGTLLYCDAHGRALDNALMYNDQRDPAFTEQIRRASDTHTGALGPVSSLAKLLHFQNRFPHQPGARAVSQADWILGQFCGEFCCSDEHNALKLGFDPIRREWPDWLETLGIATTQLPAVHPPGTPISTILPDLAKLWGLNKNVEMLAGTTDSTAAAIATGANAPGQGITSLGSTLVVKVISSKPVFAPEFGVYSHRLGDLWLAGGASNSGGAVLEHFFDIAQIRALSEHIDVQKNTGLDYYPLLRPGERFPHADSGFTPRLDPRPDSDELFLHGLLEGIAHIEQAGYDTLEKLGAPKPTSIQTAGGGSSNTTWTALRHRLLNIPVVTAEHQEAAYGTALLARNAQLRR